MNIKQSLSALAISMAVICLVSGPAYCADNETTTGVLMYVSFGALIVDTGASIGNAFTLGTGNPNRLNGYVGVISGAVSLGLVATSLAIGDDTDTRDNFAIVWGAAGVTSIVLGALNIVKAPDETSSLEGDRSILVYPEIVREPDRSYRVGLAANIRF